MHTVGDEAEALQGLAAGTIFGRYTVVRALGSGGMGAVYEATHNDLKKRVALKTLHRVVAMDRAIRARFIQEGQAASRIRHPHVVDVSDVGVVDDLPYLVMEYLDGEDLRARFKREGRLDPEALVGVMLPLLSAVHAAHEEGVVHRDLKPENIFLARTRDGGVVPKVLDFGISKMTDADRPAGLTSSSSLLGTPFYMAPEQARSSRDVDARADLYALGVILYEGLTGKVPYQGENLFAVLTAASKGGCEPPRASRPDLSVDLDAVVLRAMAVAPADRYADAPALARALLPFASAESRARWAGVFGGGPTATVVDSGVRAEDEAPAAAFAGTVSHPAPHAGSLSGASLPTHAALPPAVGPRSARRGWLLGAAALATAAVVGLVVVRPGPDRAASVPAPRVAPMAPAAVVPALVAVAPVAVAALPATSADAGAPPVVATASRRAHRGPRRGSPRVSPPGAAAEPETTVNGAPLVD